ncbi:HpcH/HpaI aldolase [Paraphoma chrysanthemicola]|uniref:HpcH/HpaI aldolase n=1 Tax=Paraphoma chrysanthemicola TaxID=798071 RepID=A0A8K0VSC1_9PLEO|nr:HpcH/HpaI aldolase [Paraphoma chrysanthemicola]
MALRAMNNLLLQRKAGSLCTAMGIRMVTDPQIVDLAVNAGYHSLFIDMEHSSLSIRDAIHLCLAGLCNGITPFVRVPHQCGNGFVQRILDGGAKGVIFPHIHTRDDAQAAVSISKYPPMGKRSMTGQLPLFSLRSLPQEQIIAESNAEGSTVFLMIETKESIGNADEIAAVEGVDVLLIGSNDLAIELGLPGQFDSERFRAALIKVSQACRKYGKIMGLAGIYDQPSIQDWAVNELGVGYILVGQDSGFLAKTSKASLAAIPNKR